MSMFALVILAQLAAPVEALPILAFPEPGIDDSASYQGYQTRFFRDAAGNTLQIYLDRRDGRAVHLWANADNESIGFTARDARGEPVELHWADDGARVFSSGSTRTLEHQLVAGASHVQLGWFVLGSMRVERDFQYAGHHRTPFDGPPLARPEIERLLTALERLEPRERARHLASLGTSDVGVLRARLQPAIATEVTDTSWVARIVQPALDGRDTLKLAIRTDPRRITAASTGGAIWLRSRAGDRVAFTVSVTTSARALTPLAREEIFTREFLGFLADATSAAGPALPGAPLEPAALRARWLERQVRGVELLVSREKLMAGLPNYATYFGRDGLLTALMMRSIWRDEMSELVIAGVLGKLSPTGQVSHEEALGGQAVREAAAEYAELIDDHDRASRAGDRASAAEALARARLVLSDLRRIRENHHMVDDEFQFPVLAASWLTDTAVPAARKREFLLDAGHGERRLDRLMRALALVAALAAPYAADPVAANLVSFPARDSLRWSPASWRDSNAGYANGRFAMDVNAIWVPHALESIRRILETLPSLGFAMDSLAAATSALETGTPLGDWARDARRLRRAIDTWSGASRHFTVRLAPAEVSSRVEARLAAMPAGERAYWTDLLVKTGAARDSLEFLAVSLDAAGRPIGVANTDVATRLFLGEPGRPIGDAATSADAAARVTRDVRLFVRPYPVGLFIDGVGPVVANDAHAPPAVWAEFERDHYHGPRVIWGREVNLFLLGVANRIADAEASARQRTAYSSELRSAVAAVLAAVEASGFQSELWSYKIDQGRVLPVRYGTSSDVQLWSTTDLAVQFALSRLGR